MQDKKQILSPQVQMLLQAKKAKPVFDNDSHRLNYVRRNLEVIGKSFSFKKEELKTVEDKFVKARDGYQIPVRFYHPEQQTKKLLLFFHGGGFISGSIDSHDRLCRKMAVESGFTIASVGYRLAPEYKFPTNVNDSLDVYHWIITLDFELIVVGGDSAGGTVAAVTTHICKNEKIRKPDLQILICPSLDLDSMDYDSYSLYSKGFALDKEDVVWGNSLHFSNDLESKFPQASPLFNSDFSALPDALIITAEYDILRDEAMLYADKLKQAGVKVNYKMYGHTIHDFIIYGRFFKEAGEAVSLIASELQRI